jgi:hypothetical protein
LPPEATGAGFADCWWPLGFGPWPHRTAVRPVWDALGPIVSLKHENRLIPLRVICAQLGVASASLRTWRQDPEYHALLERVAQPGTKSAITFETLPEYGSFHIHYIDSDCSVVMPHRITLTGHFELAVDGGLTFCESGSYLFPNTIRFDFDDIERQYLDARLTPVEYARLTRLMETFLPTVVAKIAMDFFHRPRPPSAPDAVESRRFNKMVEDSGLRADALFLPDPAPRPPFEPPPFPKTMFERK